MFTKGQRIKVKPHKRTRTIFGKAEMYPGQTVTHKGGWTGIVTNIFEGALPIEVKKDGSKPGVGYYEFDSGELEAA
jgi:preprotein translocase subunit YajC